MPGAIPGKRCSVPFPVPVPGALPGGGAGAVQVAAGARAGRAGPLAGGGTAGPVPVPVPARGRALPPPLRHGRCWCRYRSPAGAVGSVRGRRRRRRAVPRWRAAARLQGGTWGVTGSGEGGRGVPVLSGWSRAPHAEGCGAGLSPRPTRGRVRGAVSGVSSPRWGSRWGAALGSVPASATPSPGGTAVNGDSGGDREKSAGLGDGCWGARGSPVPSSLPTPGVSSSARCRGFGRWQRDARPLAASLPQPGTERSAALISLGRHGASCPREPGAEGRGGRAWRPPGGVTELPDSIPHSPNWPLPAPKPRHPQGVLLPHSVCLLRPLLPPPPRPAAAFHLGH